MGREYGRIGETNAYSFSHAFGMTAPSRRELRLSTKIGETNSFSHAFGMTAPSRREPDCQQSLSKKRRRAMRAPTDTAQPIAQMGNNLIKSSLFEGAVSEAD